MRLGADFSHDTLDPEAYAAKYREWGYWAATWSKDGVAETETICALREAFARAVVVIGEVAKTNVLLGVMAGNAAAARPWGAL